MTSLQTQWPVIETQMRPWTRWWWLGSAVDKPNITRLLEAYHQAGLGGVEITPIYGVIGQEARDIDYLSPEWLEMLRHTITEAGQRKMGVDMSTGTGWPFGGPTVTDADAEDKVVIEKTPLAAGQPVTWHVGASQPQALVAFSAEGQSVHLLDKIDRTGQLNWTPPAGDWTLYTVTQKFAGRMVKRAAPGGAGKCINPFSRQSLIHYLERFDNALSGLPHGALRCEFHDSFEYLADWEPSLFFEFEARRGYDLRSHLPALAGDSTPELNARVKTDYRETIAELLHSSFTQTYTDWAHSQGSLCRNQAHGSPGNLLDLYGTVDIPETEIFGGHGDPRSNKFASSAAHVMGRTLTSSESCTWLAEHFTVSLALAKRALDYLLVSGINHIFYHGTAYSPDDAAWPGWLFYASTTFVPTDPIWHDFGTLNTYIARCQSLLQTGEPDNDVLVYWPLHDLWQTKPEAFMLEINGKWLTEAPLGSTAQTLWDGGFAFDYISDLQLALAEVKDKTIHVPGGQYRAVVVPPCTFMPVETLKRLLELARYGSMVIFESALPTDVPGLGELDARRDELRSLLSSIDLTAGPHGSQKASIGQGAVFVGGEMKPLLAGFVRREPLCDTPGVMTIRRRHGSMTTYFVTNQGETALDGWSELGTPFHSAVLMDAMTGKVGTGHVRQGANRKSQVYLQLPPGASIIVRALPDHSASEPAWSYLEPAGEPVSITGPWTVTFIEGGPVLPAPYETPALASWTEQGNADTAAFAGTARYLTTFNAPQGPVGPCKLDLGHVGDSARIRVNGQDAGTLISPPFTIQLDTLKATGNTLEIDVTNLAANRIRDMDQKHLPWKIFHEINFVDLKYKPFDASSWPIRPSGLLGPVQIIPMKPREPK